MTLRQINPSGPAGFIWRKLIVINITVYLLNQHRVNKSGHINEILYQIQGNRRSSRWRTVKVASVTIDTHGESEEIQGIALYYG